METWKQYRDTDYYVSDEGRVMRDGSILKPSHTQDGYQKMNIKGNTHRVNRMVWEAFKGEIPIGMEINHNDEDKDNNSISNLSQMTHKENMNWGTVKSRLSKTLSKEIYMMKNEDDYFTLCFSSYKKVGEIMGWKGHHIADAASGKRRTAYGYIWKYGE